MSKKYDIATAKTLLELAFPKWDPPPYVIRDDGIYQSEEYRNASPLEEAFDWSPAYDMDALDAPDPMTAPMLPIPFGAPELAAFMLDGSGSMIPEALEYRIGDSAPNLNRFDHPRMRVVREALRESFALMQLTLQRVGPPNYEEIASAYHLLGECDKDSGLANGREGVFKFDPDISSEEIRARRERAVTSVSELNARAEQAHTTAKQNWNDWRKRMVRALLEADGLQRIALEGFQSAPDVGATEKPPQLKPQGTNHTNDTRTRTSPLAAEIKKAKTLALDGRDYQSVWSALLEMALEEKGAFTGETDQKKGLEYKAHDGNGKQTKKWLSNDALRKRMGREASEICPLLPSSAHERPLAPAPIGGSKKEA